MDFEYYFGIKKYQIECCHYPDVFDVGYDIFNDDYRFSLIFCYGLLSLVGR